MSSIIKTSNIIFGSPVFGGRFLSGMPWAGGNKRRLESRFSGWGQGDAIFVEAPNGNQIFDRRRTEQVGFKGIVKTDAFLRPIH